MNLHKQVWILNSSGESKEASLLSPHYLCPLVQMQSLKPTEESHRTVASSHPKAAFWGQTVSDGPAEKSIITKPEVLSENT